MADNDQRITEAQLSRNRAAAAVRWGDRREANNARRDHKALMLSQHIRRVVDEAPPLRPDQLARLRVLLTPAPAGDAPVHVEIAEAA